MLAPEMGSSQVEIVPQEVGQMGAGLHRSLDRARVHGESDRGHADAASVIARRNTVTWMCRSAAFATPAFVRMASATRASNCCLKSPVIRPPKSAAASSRTIGEI